MLSANGVRCGNTTKKSRSGAPLPGSLWRGKSRLYWSKLVGSLSSARPKRLRNVGAPDAGRSDSATMTWSFVEARRMSSTPPMR
ncbi:MAG: hypothetical protein A2083_02020 [Gemmatimonadetes bacterium GWC2_71_9]|nr:MAG: hypothetical protein A2083_02020 [Gemmatimonadetes bacterium GWC2_71_9]